MKDTWTAFSSIELISKYWYLVYISNQELCRKYLPPLTKYQRLNQKQNGKIMLNKKMNDTHISSIFEALSLSDKFFLAMIHLELVTITQVS